MQWVTGTQYNVGHVQTALQASGLVKVERLSWTLFRWLDAGFAQWGLLMVDERSGVFSALRHSLSPTTGNLCMELCSLICSRLAFLSPYEQSFTALSPERPAWPCKSSCYATLVEDVGLSPLVTWSRSSSGALWTKTWKCSRNRQ